MSLRKLGRYDIVRVLGKGAMGIVYEGRDPNLDRRVAIKTVKVENLSAQAAAEYEARFRTEARSAARLQHPNIVSVYDSDRHGDVAYLVMEYIQGDDLKQHLDQGERYSLEESLRMVRDLLSALDYAHKQGIIHRDIKPANLLIEPGGRVKLTDFGVARMADSGDATRTQGAMVGTLKYMSPEQVQGQKIDARADLFSAGVLLYQLLTDQRPFDGENEFTIIQQIVGQTPPPPSSCNPRLPAAIDAVVARALAKDREQRFATAGEFAAALQSALRFADDATIVPPANPARYARTQAGGIQLMTSPGTTPLGNSTVTQELELVYWKDVKDSVDAEDLQVFLAKFPAGIYADLARRRLRKLAVVESVPDDTILNGMEAVQRAEQRRAVAPTALPRTPAPEYTATIADPHEDSAPAAASAPAEATVPLAVHGATPAPTTAPATAPSPVPTPQPEPTSAPPAASITAPPPARAEGSTVPLPVPGTETVAGAPRSRGAAHKPSPLVLAGAGAILVAGVAAWLLLGRPGSETAIAPPSAGASAAAPSASAAAGSSQVKAEAVVSAPAARHVAAAAPAVRPAASVARKPVAAKAPAAASAAPAPSETMVPASSPSTVQVREEVRSAPPPRTPATNPADVCKDKMFLSREFCLAEQCDKPAARNHPLCVQRREDAKLREESKVRN